MKATCEHRGADARVKARLDLPEALRYAFLVLQRVDQMPCATPFVTDNLRSPARSRKQRGILPWVDYRSGNFWRKPASRSVPPRFSPRNRLSVTRPPPKPWLGSSGAVHGSKARKWSRLG